MSNPYQASAMPSEPTGFTRLFTTKRLVVTMICLSGPLALIARDWIVMTFFWGNAGTVTGETSFELIAKALLDHPLWRLAQIRLLVATSPTLLVTLLWLRRRVS